VDGAALELQDLANSPEWGVALARAHHEVFGSDVDADWFRWKYAQGVGAGLFSNEGLAAFCGGVPRTLWWRGQQLKGLQITDVMVREPWRQVGRRGGAFARVCAAFYGRQLGALAAGSGGGERGASVHGAPFDLGYGFPSHRHLKLAEMLGLLRDGGPVMAAVWTDAARAVMDQVLGDAAPGADPWLAEELDTAEALRAAQRGWSLMRNALHDTVVGERGWEVLHWRYAAQPRGSTLGLVRFLGLRRPWRAWPSGVLVVRDGGHKATWLDWIGPPAMLRLAWAHALSSSLSRGAAEMHGWFSARPWAMLTQTSAAGAGEAARLGIPVAGRFTGQELAGASWWMMAGDTDFL
jgi:hypothetical protein